MGFAESLRKVNYLAPAWEVIARARQQNKQEQARENFLKALDQAYGKVQEIDNAPVATIDAEGYSQNPNNWTPAPQTISSSQNLFNKNAGQLTAPPPSPNMNMSDDPAKTMNIPVPPKIPMDNQLNELGMLPDAEIGPSKDNTKVRQLQTNEIVNFMKGQLGNKDLDPNLLNQGSGLLSMLLRKPSSTKLEQIDTSKDLYSIDENTGKWTLVKPGKDKLSDMKNLWMKVGDANKNGRKVATLRNYLTGETQTVDLGEATKVAGEGNNNDNNLDNENDYNYSNLYSNLQEGLKTIQTLKNTKLTQTKDANGNPVLSFYPPGASQGMVFQNQAEFDQYKETEKRKYLNDAYELMNQRGLDGPTDNTPVKEIRKGLANGYTLEEALKKFKQHNPTFPEKDLNMMADYFKLSKM